MDRTLEGCRILIVEEDGALVDQLRAAFRDSGVTVVGPALDADAALALVKNHGGIDGAVLGMQNGRRVNLALADELARRDIPFVFSDAASAASAKQRLDIEPIITTLSARISDKEVVAVERHTTHRSKIAPAEIAQNRFLQMMQPEDRALFLDASVKVELQTRDILTEEQKVIQSVYFPLTAVVSIMVAAQDARPIEVGMVGSEGHTDLVLRDGDLSALRNIVIVAGTALCIPADAFARAIWSRPSIYRLMLAYKEALSIQFAFSALSHGTSTIDARLARWILMLQDRLQIESIPMVHNLIAEALAVRRSGVTTALHVLEGLGAIKSVRGTIIVRDRSILQGLAGSTYGIPEAEYARIMKEARQEADSVAAS